MTAPSPLRRMLALVLAAASLAAASALAAAPAFAHGEGAAPGGELAAAIGADYDRISGRFVELAEAFPADKFGWRPADGVRSVSEVAMHVAAANFALASALGVAPPEGTDLEKLEEITDRDRVLATLGTSIEHAQRALESGGSADLGRTVNAFGFEMPAARAVVILDAHSHEHLGQLIAYARSNGIVPPWSRPSDDGGE